MLTMKTTHPTDERTTHKTQTSKNDNQAHW